MKHIFVVNPVSGSGKSVQKHLPELLAFLKGSDLDYEVHRSLNKEEIGSYVRQRAKEGTPVRFYAIGGDGTLCDVVNGAMGFENAEVSVIPCGTGNDFVRNFTNKKNFFDYDKLVNGTAIPVDVIDLNGTYSINMLNIGADCEVAACASKVQTKHGSWAYIKGAMEVLPKTPKYKMVYTDENGEQREEDLLLCAIGNGQYCGGGFRSCPEARLDDGLLDVVIARPVKGMKLVKLLLKYRQGTHMQSPDAKGTLEYFHVKEFSLKPIDPVNVSIDGEVVPFEGAEIKVLPKAIKFVVPQGSEPIEAKAQKNK